MKKKQKTQKTLFRFFFSFVNEISMQSFEIVLSSGKKCNQFLMFGELWQCKIEQQTLKQQNKL